MIKYFLIFTILVFCLKVYPDLYVACSKGENIDYYSLDGKYLKSYKLKFVPDFSPSIKNENIIYTNSGNIVIENINKKDFKIYHIKNNSDHKISFKNNYLYSFDYNYNKTRIIFCTVKKRTTEITSTGIKTTYQYKDLFDYNLLWEYNLEKNKLTLIDNIGAIENPRFFENNIFYSKIYEVFRVDRNFVKYKYKEIILNSMKNKDEYKEIILNSSENKDAYCFRLVKPTKIGFLFMINKEAIEGSINSFIGLYEYSFKNTNIINIPIIKDFKKEFFFNTIIIDISNDYRYLILSDHQRSSIFLIDVMGIKENLLSQNSESTACFVDYLVAR